MSVIDFGCSTIIYVLGCRSTPWIEMLLSTHFLGRGHLAAQLEMIDLCDSIVDTKRKVEKWKSWHDSFIAVEDAAVSE